MILRRAVVPPRESTRWSSVRRDEFPVCTNSVLF